MKQILARVAHLDLRWLLIVALGGCGAQGPEFAPVNGCVRLDGNPAPKVMVVFQPQQGNASHGLSDELGRYRLKYSSNQDGALVGLHRVKIFTPTRDDGSQPPEIIPAKYLTGNSIEKQVQAGDNQIDLELSAGQSPK